MYLKYFNHVLFPVIIMILSFTAADYVRCKFGRSLFNKYSCEIKSIRQKPKDENIIEGFHWTDESGKEVLALSWGNPRSSAKINLTAFDSVFCRDFPNLELIKFVGVTVSLMDKNALQNCTKLKKLELVKGSIKELPAKFLPVPSKLRTLDLKQNNIATIPERFLYHQRQLEELDLTSNQITSLEDACFENLEKLIDLNLSNNNITDLPEGIFNSLFNLQKLSLTNNQLRFIHSDSFGTHKTLAWLYIENNKIEGIDEMFVNKTISSAANVKLFISSNVCHKDLFVIKDLFRVKLKKCIDRMSQNDALRTPKIKCGRVVYGKSMVYGGRRIARRDFPWMAVVMGAEGYFCGGVLVSKRKVITAAHCIQDKDEASAKLARDISVMLGMHNISDSQDSEKKIFKVETINMHPDWNPNVDSYDADIAILYLAKEVLFNDYIRPICLTKPDSAAASIINATVVGFGWGNKSEAKIQDIAKALDMPIHNNEDCFLRDNDLTQMSSRRTFCAGSADGTGVCVGDSGSGIYVKYEDVFYLRGIVSSTVRENQFSCKASTYSVFTNVLKFNDWIDLTGGNPNLYTQ